MTVYLVIKTYTVNNYNWYGNGESWKETDVVEVFRTEKTARAYIETQKTYLKQFLEEYPLLHGFQEKEAWCEAHEGAYFGDSDYQWFIMKKELR